LLQFAKDCVFLPKPQDFVFPIQKPGVINFLKHAVDSTSIERNSNVAWQFAGNRPGAHMVNRPRSASDRRTQTDVRIRASKWRCKRVTTHRQRPLRSVATSLEDDTSSTATFRWRKIWTFRQPPPLTGEPRAAVSAPLTSQS